MTYIRGCNDFERQDMKGNLCMNKVKWLEETCNNCGSQINSWDKRISKTLAYRYPNCEKCIAEEYDMSVEALRDRMERFFGMRPCMGI